MSDDQRRDRDVGSWIRADAPIHAPNRLRETIRAQLAETRQESGPALVMRRGMLLSPLRGVLAAATILALGAVVGGLIGSRGTIGNQTVPTPVPTPSPSTSLPPSSSPVPTPSGSGLAAGDQSTQAFAPKIRFTVPDGWVVVDDRPLSFRMAPKTAGFLRQSDGAMYFDGIAAIAGPVAGQPDGTTTPVTGVGKTSKDLAAWLSSRPQLIATPAKRVTLAGLPAWQVDFSLSPRAGDLCGVRCTNFLDSPDGGQSYRFGIEGSWAVRAFLLEAPDGTTVMITVEDVDGSGLEQEMNAARPILDSMAFAP